MNTPAIYFIPAVTEEGARRVAERVRDGRLPCLPYYLDHEAARSVARRSCGKSNWHLTCFAVDASQITANLPNVRAA